MTYKHCHGSHYRTLGIHGNPQQIQAVSPGEKRPAPLYMTYNHHHALMLGPQDDLMQPLGRSWKIDAEAKMVKKTALKMVKSWDIM
jgi:hypothetical protein